MDRRSACMAITGGLLLAVAAGAIAQSTPKRAARIVLFSTGRPETHSYLTEAFRMAMRELGYVEGRDVVYSYRWADGRMDRVSQLASEIARDNPDIVITGTALSTRAVVEAAPGAAVVMAYGSDPVGNQLVASLARPGGRVTGLSNLGEGIVPKMLELLRAMVPKAGRFALLVNPTNMTTHKFVADAELAAAPLKLSVNSLAAETPEAVVLAFDRIARERPHGVVVVPDPLFLTMRTRLVGLATHARIPAIYFQREFVETGGLMSYGASIRDAYARAAVFVDKVLKGANPGDLPVEQPTKFELVINLKTAKELGIVTPQTLLLRADEVIS